MILNFYVENFKSIRNGINLSFEPVHSKSLDEYDEYYVSPIKILKMALILGPNASGKTNILEALAFLQSFIITPFNDKNIELNLEPFILNKDKDTIFSIEFVNDKRYLYEVQLNKKYIVKESLYDFSPKKSLIFERTTDKEKKLSQIKFGSKIKISSVDKHALITNTLWNNTVIASFRKTNIKFEVLQSVLNWFQESLIIVSPLKSAVANIVNRYTHTHRALISILNFFDEASRFDSISKNVLNEKIPKNQLIELLSRADLSVNNIEVEEIKQENTKENIESQEIKIPSYFKTIIQHSYEEKFSLLLDEESSGTQRYYVLVGTLLKALNENKLNENNKTKIIVIDEIEKSLHPDLLEHFILTFLKICKKYNFQLIATTHNRELLMDKDLIKRKDIIWLTEKKADGSTDLFSISDIKSDIKKVRKENSLYNFYKIGRLGAKPNLIDPLDEDNEQ